MPDLLAELADQARDFVTDLRENYDSTYWWADHPILRVALLSIVAGGVGLTFHYLQLRMDRNMIGAPNA